MTHRAGWIVLAMMACAANGLAGQTGGITLRGGELGADAAGARRIVAAGRSSTDASWQEWVRIPIAGFLLDRRVFSWAMTVRPSLRQQVSTLMAEDLNSRNLGLDLSATLLQAKLLSVGITASRAAGSSQGAFGTETEFRNSTLGATAFLRYRMLPITLSYARRSLSDNWFGPEGLTPIRREEAVRSLRLTARNSRINAWVERLEFDDRILGQDFESTEWAADHLLRWGKGSSITTRLGQIDRTGYTPFDRSTWSERLLLQHTTSLATEYQYDRQTWFNGGSAHSRAGATGVIFRPATSVALSGRASAQVYDQPEGRTARTRAGPDITFQLRLPLGARFTAGVTAGWERLDRDLPADAEIQVIDEPHVIDAGRSFSLGSERAVEASIDVRNQDRTLSYIRDVDYRTATIGELVQIFIPPTSRIEEGQTVLVSYRFMSRDAGRLETWNASYNAAISWQGITLRHGRVQREETPLDAGGGLSLDRDVWTSIGLNRGLPIGQVQAWASWRNRLVRDVEYDIRELRGGLRLPPVAGITMSLNGTVVTTVTPETSSRNETASANADWSPSRSLRLGAGLDAWRWQPDDGGIDRYFAGHATVEWRAGRIQVNARYDRTVRFLTARTSEHRWSVYVLRRF